MDIASNIPFTLKLLLNFPTTKEQNASIFYHDEKKMWKQNGVTLSAEENDEIQIIFDSEDRNARLYLDALDIMPVDDQNTRVDESGRIYRVPMKGPFILYKSNSGYDALRVDTFKICVECMENKYYGTFQILPKPMSYGEWNMMKNDLEKEIHGLAQDIVRKNIGIGDMQKGDIPPKALYDFLVIKRYSRNVMMALIDIADNPRSEIKTQYENVSINSGKNYTFDTETVKRYITKAGAEPVFKVPVKTVYYDIQDNRLLKKIVLEYEQKLDQFIELLNGGKHFFSSFNSNETEHYKDIWKQSILEFKEVAVKLRKMTSVIRTKDWYREISALHQPYIPHTFIMDSRYNILYQMYMDLKKNQLQVELDPEFSYTWKRSSYLYEMWSYFRICNILAANFQVNIDEFKFIFSDKVLFPFLKSGSIVTFEDSQVIIEVIFDAPLPTNSKDTEFKRPLFIAKPHSKVSTHNRPDIVLNIFDKAKEWYLGTLIFECKYRKLNSFWSENSQWSSRGQLEAYYNNARSEYLYGGLGNILQSRPVKKVFVLTPDHNAEGREQKEFEILVKDLKPSMDDSLQKSVEEAIINEIISIKETGQKVKNIKNSE